MLPWISCTSLAWWSFTPDTVLVHLSGSNLLPWTGHFIGIPKYSWGLHISTFGKKNSDFDDVCIGKGGCITDENLGLMKTWKPEALEIAKPSIATLKPMKPINHRNQKTTWSAKLGSPWNHAPIFSETRETIKPLVPKYHGKPWNHETMKLSW